MSNQENTNQQQQPTTSAASPAAPAQQQPIPDDLQFLNDPIPSSSPAAAATTTASTTNTSSNNLNSEVSGAGAAPVTRGILISDGGAESTFHQQQQHPQAHALGVLDDDGAGVVQGDVIMVFEDSQGPAAGEPMITKPAIALSFLVIAITVIYPFFIGNDQRFIDIISLGCFLPAVGAFAYLVKSHHSELVSPINAYVKFFVGYILMCPMAWMVALVTIFLGVLVLSLFFGLTHLYYKWLIFASFSILLVCGIIIPEELAKLFGAQRDNVRKNINNPRQYVVYSLFAALGMATFEAYFMVHYIRRSLDFAARREASNYNGSAGHTANGHQAHPVVQHGGGDAMTQTPGGMTSAPQAVRDFAHAFLVQTMERATSAPTAHATTQGGLKPTQVDLVDGTDIIVIFVMCLVCIIPMHVLSGYHVGLGIARRDILNSRENILKLLWAPVLFRSVFLWIIWFLPFVTKIDEAGFAALILIPLYFKIVYNDERKMPRSYLLRSGYMNAFGYGVLPEGEDEALEDDAAGGNGGDSLEMSDDVATTTERSNGAGTTSVHAA